MSIFKIPALIAVDQRIAPTGLVTADPGSEISAEDVRIYGGTIVNIYLAPKGGTGRVEIGNVQFEISDDFTIARGSPTGSNLEAADQDSVLIGMAHENNGAASDLLVGGSGNDRLEVFRLDAIAHGNGGQNVYVLPKVKNVTVGKGRHKKVYPIDVWHDAKEEEGDEIIRRS